MVGRGKLRPGFPSERLPAVHSPVVDDSLTARLALQGAVIEFFAGWWFYSTIFLTSAAASG
jgi:hypothetical protein